MNRVRKGLSIKNIVLLWVIGIAGQLCWNIENQWFNVYVYSISNGDYKFGTNVITFMMIFSALFTAFSTFFFGTWSDRIGKRKPFICFGYIIWGVFTILFGVTGKLNGLVAPWLLGTIIVLADSIMSFFGSMGNDSGFSAWTTDMLNDDSKGAIGIAIAAQPVIGTIAGTVIGGIVSNAFIGTYFGGSKGYGAYIILAGIMILIIGVITIFTMQDEKNIEINKEGSFWKQFFSNFNFKRFFAIKELVLVNAVLAIFFIGWNCFFNYIANLFVYNFGFDSATFGYIEGIALVIGIVIMVVVSKLVKGNKTPLITGISIICEIIGLLILALVAIFELYDANSFLCASNLVLILGVLFVGYGYVTFMQNIMVWAKELYPSDVRGQFEGIKCLSFVLIPMIFGSIFSNILINSYGKVVDTFNEDLGILVQSKVPNESLFFAGMVIMALALIPLYFVSKMYKQRVNSK